MVTNDQLKHINNITIFAIGSTFNNIFGRLLIYLLLFLQNYCLYVVVLCAVIALLQLF